MRHALAVGAALICFAGALVVATALRHVLLLGFAAVAVASVLSWPIDRLARWLPREAAVVITLVLVAALLAGGARAAAPRLTEQFETLVEKAPRAAFAVERWWESVKHAGQTGAPLARVTTSVESRLARALAELAPKALSLAAALAEILTGAVVVAVMAIFFASSPPSYHAAVRRMVPRAWEPRLDEAWRRTGAVLRRWMGGMLVAMTLMGSLTAIGLAIAGVDGWLALGVLTFVGTFVPYVGAIASAVPGLMAALADSPRRFVYALIVYLGVHFVEGYLVQPQVMKRAVWLRPALLLFFEVVMGALFGMLGIVVATPLYACLQVLVGYLWIEEGLGKRPDQ